MIRADFCCPSAKAVIIKLLSHSGCLNFYGEPLASEPAEVDWKRQSAALERGCPERCGQEVEAARGGGGGQGGYS